MSSAPKTAPLRSGHVHIDRLNVRGPLEHRPLGELLFKGHPDYGYYAVGSQALGGAHRRKSDPNAFYVRSHCIGDNQIANEVEFDCCPPKVLQGHNFFGTNDVLEYTAACFERLVSDNKIKVGDSQREEWHAGDAKMHGIHLTANFRCPYAKLPIFDAIDQNNRTGKRRDLPTCISLGFKNGKRSDYDTLSIYDKFVLLSQEWKNPGPLQSSILWAAERSLRVELKLHWRWLRTYGVNAAGHIVNLKELREKDSEAAKQYHSLAYVKSWAMVDLDALFFDTLKGYNVSNAVQGKLSEAELQRLSNAERRAYRLWFRGEDLFENYSSPSTVYKYIRRVFKETGVSMKGARPPEDAPTIDLAQMLTPQNVMPLPKWAEGSPRYWAPGTARAMAQQAAEAQAKPGR